MLVAVLLPITVLAIGAAALLRERYDTAQRAASIMHDVPTLNRLADLRRDLDQERMPVEGRLRAAQFGFDIPNVSSMLGLTSESEPAARQSSDAELRALGAAAPAGFAQRLHQLRARADRNQLGPTEVDGAYEQLDLMASADFAARLAVLQSRIAGLGNTSQLQGALHSLEDANDALSAAVRELSDVSEVQLPGAHPASQLSQLGADMALLAQAGEHLHDAGGLVAKRWAGFVNSPNERSFQGLVATAASAAAATTSGEVPRVA
jgi:hypothetical protein